MTRSEARIESLSGIASSLAAVLIALVAGGAVIALAGVNPFTAYGTLIQGAFGSRVGLVNTLIKAAPLLIGGIGLSISFKCRLINIGAEGQMIMGGIAATAIALYAPVQSPFLMGILAFAGGFAGGALFGFIPGWLKAKFGISEIINTIMLNYVASNLLSFLLDGPMREPGNYYPQSARIAREFWFPNILPDTRLHLGFALALAFTAVYYLFMYRMPAGFRIRMVGFSERASRYAGINVKANLVAALVLSGGIAGLAGMSEVFGMHHRLFNDFTAGYGFDAIPIALLGRLHPLGVAAAALFFGALRVGANAMQRAVQVPVSVVAVIQGVSVLLILTEALLRDTALRAWRRSRIGQRLRKVEEASCP